MSINETGRLIGMFMTHRGFCRLHFAVIGRFSLLHPDIENTMSQPNEDNQQAPGVKPSEFSTPQDRINAKILQLRLKKEEKLEEQRQRRIDKDEKSKEKIALRQETLAGVKRNVSDQLKDGKKWAIPFTKPSKPAPQQTQKPSASVLLVEKAIPSDIGLTEGSSIVLASKRQETPAGVKLNVSAQPKVERNRAIPFTSTKPSDPDSQQIQQQSPPVLLVVKPVQSDIRPTESLSIILATKQNLQDKENHVPSPLKQERSNKVPQRISFNDRPTKVNFLDDEDDDDDWNKEISFDYLDPVRLSDRPIAIFRANDEMPTPNLGTGLSRKAIYKVDDTVLDAIRIGKGKNISYLNLRSISDKLKI
jgi:hypothetical protein